MFLSNMLYGLKPKHEYQCASDMTRDNKEDLNLNFDILIKNIRVQTGVTDFVKRRRGS